MISGLRSGIIGVAFRFIGVAFRFVGVTFRPPFWTLCHSRVPEDQTAVYLLSTFFLPGTVCGQTTATLRERLPVDFVPCRRSAPSASMR